MKPTALRIERLLAKVEAELARSARPRRYCFYEDEIAEAEAQGLPYFLVPRELSREVGEGILPQRTRGFSLNGEKTRTARGTLRLLIDFGLDETREISQ